MSCRLKAIKFKNNSFVGWSSADAAFNAILIKYSHNFSQPRRPKMKIVNSMIYVTCGVKAALPHSCVKNRPFLRSKRVFMKRVCGFTATKAV